MTTANSSRTELIFIPRASIPHYRVTRTQDKQGVDIYLTETKSHGFESPQTGFPGKDEERHQRRVGFYPSPTCRHTSMRGLFNIHATESSAGGNHSRPWHLATAKAFRTSWT